MGNSIGDDPSIRAYLFDLDGTLADSEVLKGRALAHACASYGADSDYRIYAEVMGEDWETVTGHFFRTYRISPDLEKFNDRFRRHYLDLIDSEIIETKGAKDFVRQSKAKGLKVGLVSSAAPWMVEKILAKLGFEDIFDVIVTHADVARHKPLPDAYLLALERLGLEAAEVIVFEDSHAGLRASHAAGCRSIAIRHAFNTRHDLSSATRLIRAFTEIL